MPEPTRNCCEFCLYDGQSGQGLNITKVTAGEGTENLDVFMVYDNDDFHNVIMVDCSTLNLSIPVNFCPICGREMN